MSIEEYVDYEDLLELFQEEGVIDSRVITDLYEKIGKMMVAINYHRYPDDWVGNISIHWSTTTYAIYAYDSEGRNGIYHRGVIYPEGTVIDDNVY